MFRNRSRPESRATTARRLQRRSGRPALLSHLCGLGALILVAHCGRGAGTTAPPPPTTIQVTPLTFYDPPFAVGALALSSDGTKLYLGGSLTVPPPTPADPPRPLSIFQILDLSSAGSPKVLVGWAPLGSSVIRVIRLSADGTRAYVGASFGVDAGLAIVDVSNPALPILLGTYGVPVSDVALSPDGRTAYLAAREHGLQIIDVSNPAAPLLVGRHDANPNCSVAGEPALPAENCGAFSVTLAHDGRTVYVASEWGGIEILDVSSPASPTLLGTAEAGRSDEQTVISSGDGARAYAAAVSPVSAFHVLSVRDPSAPTVIGRLAGDSGIYSAIELSGDGTKAYLAGGSTGFAIVDVRDPATLRRVAGFADPVRPGMFDLAVWHDALGVLAAAGLSPGTERLWIVQIQTSP